MTPSAPVRPPDPCLGAARKLRDSALPARQHEALDRWIALAERRGVTRADLGPALFGRTLQYVALVEVLDDGEDFRHRIEGREVVRRFGSAGDDRFSALYTPAHFGSLRAFYTAVRLGRRPARRHFMVRSIEGEELAFSQLALPSMDEDGTIGHCAVVFDFPAPIRSLPTAPLAIAAPWRRLRKGAPDETMLGDRRWR